MHQTKKGNEWYFGMKCHIGADAESGLVHTVRGTSANVHDVVEANALLHGDEKDVIGDAGYQGAHKRADARKEVRWHIAMRPGKRKALDLSKRIDRMIDELEHTKASIRAKVEHPFRVIKRQFGFVKVRLSRFKEKHVVTYDLVRSVQLMDGASQVGDDVRNANPAQGRVRHVGANIAPRTPRIASIKIN